MISNARPAGHLTAARRMVPAIPALSHLQQHHSSFCSDNAGLPPTIITTTVRWNKKSVVCDGGCDGGWGRGTINILFVSLLSLCPSCHSVVVWRTRQGKDDGASNNRAAELINQSQSLDTTPPVIDQTSIYLHHLHHLHLHHLNHLHHLQLILPDNITTIAISLESEILF